MKFSDVRVEENFVIGDDPIVYTKVVHQRSSCCFPEFNSKFVGKQEQTKFKFFLPNDEVDKETKNITLKNGEEMEEQNKTGLEALIEDLETEIDIEAEAEAEIKAFIEARPTSISSQFRLSQVPVSTVFRYRGEKYIHSLKERSGGGKVAIVNIETQQEHVLSGLTMCDVYADDVVDLSKFNMNKE